MTGSILIVDDEASVVEVLVRFLSSKGYECVSETSATNALQLLESCQFEVIMTDLHMPEVSGIELVDRARELMPNASIICVTAMHDIEIAVQAIRSGADDYVLKPFNLKDIEAAVLTGMETYNDRISAEAYRNNLEERIESATNDLGRVHRELHETKLYLESLVNGTADAIIAASTDGTIEFINRGAQEMLGYKDNTILGTLFSKLLRDRQKEFEAIQRNLASDKKLLDYETELLAKDGTAVPVTATLSLVPGDDGSPRSILAVCKNMTEQLRLRQELHELSIRDSLTGLYNQGHFHESLQGEIERSRRQRHTLSLMLFDVDRFKEYNDSQGHLEGDGVLKTIGNIVRECTRTHVDQGFRYGGDEFCIILAETRLEESLPIAERIRSRFEERNFGEARLSIGLTEFKGDEDAKDLVSRADALMYQAKRSGGNRVATIIEEQPAVPEGKSV